MTNLDHYKNDLNTLIDKGNMLQNAIYAECFPEEFNRLLKKDYPDEYSKILKDLPSFLEGYQPWYSESKALIKQLLPDRLSDFVRYYEKPKPRKDITTENYRI